MVKNVTAQVKQDQINYIEVIEGSFKPADWVIHVKTKEDLPESAKYEDMAYVDADGQFYRYTGIEWKCLKSEPIPVDPTDKILNRVFTI